MSLISIAALVVLVGAIGYTLLVGCGLLFIFSTIYKNTIGKKK